MSGGAVRAGGAFVELFADDKRLRAGLQSAGASLKSWATTAAIAGAGVAVAGAGMLLALGHCVDAAVEFGSAIKDASDRTGIASEELQALKFAAEQSGASFEDLETAFQFMRKGGHGQTVQDFLNLLDDIPNAANPAAETVEKFGRGGLKLGGMMQAGSVGVQAMMDQAHALGLVLGGADVDAAEALGDDLAILGKQFQMLKVEIGSAVIPLLKELMPLLMDVGKAAIQFVRDNKELGGGLRDVFKDVVSFLRAGEFEAAWQRIFLSLRIEFLKFGDWLDEQWQKYGRKVVDNAQTGIGAGLINAWGHTADFFAEWDQGQLDPAESQKRWDRLRELKKTLREDAAEQQRMMDEEGYTPDANRARLRRELEAQLMALRQRAESLQPGIGGDVATAGNLVAAQMASAMRRAVAAVTNAGALSEMTRGTFAGTGISQSLAIADKVTEKIAENTKRTADGVEDLADKIEKMQPVYG